MKKTKRIIILIVLLAILFGALYFSPVITLLKMKHEVSSDGIGALQPYLAEEFQTPFTVLLKTSRGVAFAGNAIQTLTGKTSSIKAVFGLLQDKTANIKWSLSSFMRGLNEANASFKVSSKDFSGSIALLLKREKGKWVIYNLSIPLLGWSLG